MEKIKEFVLSRKKQVIAFALILVFLICSPTILAKTFTNPQAYSATIQSIDEKKVTVLGVSAAIAGSSTLLSSVPGDAAQPLAEELMDLSSYLIAVVCVLVLEKSLLTVFGAVACYVLIPIACIFALVFVVNNKSFFISWAIKLGALALTFLMIVPASMRLSDYIYEVNQISLAQEETIADSIETETENGEDVPWYKRLWDSVTNAVTETAEAAIEHGKKVLNEFIDAVSLFVIAYCVIPLFVVFLLLWLLKILFKIKLDVKLDAITQNRFFKRKAKTELENF